ncbi:54S ribosomal protein L20, mitochondrial [[Candida] railenensis]|uniref:54S ribosomal protein L20, mitochondrial n=1 Tax=[Candida] railenensis TaxID=45579 RepID=A0A9P0VYZ2_9ASCO|nr:54S ribosomal protein L20, mitochondrial [[Candida] railenensis]
MFRNTVRHLSDKAVPFLSQPPNKFNAARSTFNLRPVLPQGLVHNPPASVPNSKSTPRAFLPSTDPRSTLISHRTYSSDEVADMPIIYSSKADRKYDITPDIVAEIQQLRSSNSAEWTVNKLAKKFGVSPSFVKVTTEVNEGRKAELSQQQKAERESWPVQKQKARINRKRRVELWLRNEF